MISSPSVTNANSMPSFHECQHFGVSAAAAASGVEKPASDNDTQYMRKVPIMTPFNLLLLTILAPLAFASQLHLTTPASLPPLPPSTRALLTQPSIAAIAAPVTTTNGFVFRNLTSGIYDLTIACRDYDFERDIIVEVDDAGKVEVFRVGNYGTGAKTSIATGVKRAVLEIKAIRRKEFYEERVGCEWTPAFARQA